MEENRKASLPRQASFSRRGSIVPSMMVSARWRKLTCSLIFLSVGIFCGFVFSYMTSSLTNSPFNRLPKSFNYHPAAERAARIAAAEEAGKNNGAKTRRKDLSVQFRDYIPRHIFINCGGTFPDTIELFLETYPSSEKFVMYSFLPDSSYAPLYAAYDSHVTVSPAVCGVENSTVSMRLETISGTEVNATIPSIDIAKWIDNNTHADEHIVFKIDSSIKREKGIAERFAGTSVLEYINKYYTTSKNKKILEFYENVFSERQEKVLHWDNARETYSDFETVNPVRNPSTSKSVIKECGNAKTLRHPLFFYASENTHALNTSIRVLKAFSDSQNKRISAALFLPFDAIKTYHTQLETIQARIDVGVYLNISMKSKSNDSELKFKRLVNKFVGAENRFGSAGLILHHVLAGRAMSSELMEKIITARHYNVFVKTIDIIPDRARMNATIADMPDIPDYEVPILDVSHEEAVKTMLYLISRYGSIITPLQECLKYTHTVD